ncbi:sugar porter family MFS transporter [Cetobacterium somerae]
MSKEKYVIYIAVLTASFGYIFDFDSAVISSSIEILASTFKIDKRMVGILITIVLIGGLVGGLCAGYFSEKIGRKKTIIYSLIGFLIGGFITIFSINIEMFMLGRLVMGLGLGSIFLVGSIYIIEISPIETRGRNGTINQLFMPFGLVVGFWLAYLITNSLTNRFIINNSWRVLFFLETFQGLIIFILFLKIPESPRWLYLKGFKDKARESLKKVLPDERVEKVMEELNITESNEKMPNKRNFQSITKGIKIVLFLVVVSAIFKQFSGINPIIYYAPEIFQETSLVNTSGYFQSVTMGVYEILGSVIVLFLIDKYGRKKLLFYGTLIMTISLGYLAYALFYKERGVYDVYSVYIYNLTYTVAFGTALTVYISEITPNSIRSLGVTLFNVINYIFDITLTQIYPVIDLRSESLPFFIFFIISLLSLFFIPLIPETKGKTLEEIGEYWNKIK